MLLLLPLLLVILPVVKCRHGGADDTVNIFRELLTNRAATPPFDDSEAPGAWRFTASKGYRLPATTTRRVVQDLSNRNFSIDVVFKAEPNTSGSLFSVVSGSTRFLEVNCDLQKLQITVFLSVRDSIRSWAIQVNISDSEFHQFILEIHRDRVLILLDCVQYLARDVSGLFQTAMPAPGSSRPMEIWLGSRDVDHMRFAGLIRTLSISRGNILREAKCPQSDLYRKQAVNKLYQTKTKPLANLDPLELDEEAFLDQSVDEDITAPVTEEPKRTPLEFDPKLKSKLDILERKVNRLDTEFEKVRDVLKRYQDQLRKVQLYQRGCYVDDTWIREGQPIPSKQNCTECLCFEGKPLCIPIGCKLVTCKNPVLESGQCCPVCMQQCEYSGKVFEHGVSYSPRRCLSCICDNGDMLCQYQNPRDCPSLNNCPREKHVRPPNECCAICADSDFCTMDPCHANATCVKRQYNRECRCNKGYFGNGENCFDINECQLPGDGTDRSCGTGTKCINLSGSFKCECIPGYTRLDEFACVDQLNI